jgi:hypothetical protein
MWLSLSVYDVVCCVLYITIYTMYKPYLMAYYYYINLFVRVGVEVDNNKQITKRSAQWDNLTCPARCSRMSIVHLFEYHDRQREEHEHDR